MSLSLSIPRLFAYYKDMFRLLPVQVWLSNLAAGTKPLLSVTDALVVSFLSVQSS